jgi:hypothetical protein
MKKVVKIIFLVCLAVFLSNSTNVSSENKCNDNCLETVRNFTNEKKLGFSTSFSEKQMNRLGDNVSFALKRIYVRKEIITSDNVGVVLAAVEEAFRFPEMITNENDKKPKSTIKLLQHMKKQADDEVTKTAIDKTLDFVIKKTKGIE